MLKKCLIAKTSPQANEKNIVFWHDYRVTVLSDRLFRMEKCADGVFRDDATQCVWFRDMPQQAFTFTDKGKTATVDTATCALVLTEERKNCKVVLGGKSVRIDNRGNLKGTYRTLDCCDGDRNIISDKQIALENGVCSQSGVACFDDARSLTLDKTGKIVAEHGHGTDEYVFAYGNDYLGAVNALFALTGKPPMVPRYALGNWWSRYHAYTDKEYIGVLNAFEERKIPLTVATVDMDWHYSSYKEINELFDVQRFAGEEYIGKKSPFGIGWTGYSWNKRLFPDYKRFLREVKGKNLAVTLNLHPADGVRYFEDRYAEFAAAVGADPATKKQIPFDFTDDNFVNAYFDLLHHPYERDGVDFWWIDWQQGTQSALAGLDPLWSLNHYHFLDKASASVPLILSRYCGIGSHRYPLGFSGDTIITWKTLRYLPYFTATASNVGYTWWSHDIGGHMLGRTDRELYVRFLQFGVFNPINRLHSSNAETVSKEPWLYAGGAGEIAANFMRLRHKMIPYLYTAAYRTHTEGTPLVMPLYYKHAQKEAYRYRNEYYFGSELLVVPATERTRKDGYARVRAWLPEGHWTDIFTGDEYDIPAGGRERTLLRALNEYPVFAKSGAILPLSGDKGNGCGNPAVLAVRVFPGNGTFSLYEEKDGKHFFTHFETALQSDKEVQTVRVSAEGDAAVLPQERKTVLVFENLDAESVNVTVNGKEVPFETFVAEKTSVKFPFDPLLQYEVTVKFAPRTGLQKQLLRAQRILTETEEDNAEKSEAWKALQKAADERQLAEIIAHSSLPQGVRMRLSETLPFDDVVNIE